MTGDTALNLRLIVIAPALMVSSVTTNSGIPSQIANVTSIVSRRDDLVGIVD